MTLLLLVWKVQQFYKCKCSFLKKINLIEKEDQSKHQTGNNSNSLRLYYTPGSNKAKNCVLVLVKFSKENNINHDVCGKVVVATHKRELQFLDKIYKNGIDNNTEGIERINDSQIKEIEPEVNGLSGIWVPCTGIIDYVEATQKMIDIASLNQNSKVLFSYEVLKLTIRMV